MAITVRQVPTALRWRHFREVDVLPDDDGGGEDAQVNPVTDIPQDMAIVQTDTGRLRLGDVTIDIRVDRHHTAVLRSASQTATLLKHEQGHHDLFFLAMRAFGKDLEAIEAADPDDLLHQMQEAGTLHNGRAQTIDDAYDTRTLHGRNADEQAAWDAAIDAAKQDPLSTHIFTLPF